MRDEQTRLQDALAKLFIARPDVIAIQRNDGAYNPLEGIKWSRDRLSQHIRGSQTYGHYAINGEHAKFFCFDLDFKTKCTLYPEDSPLHNPRKHWQETNGADPYLRWQLRTMADLFTYRIARTGTRQLATFSGSKGVHVYGFPKPGILQSAASLRKTGQKIMDDMGYFFQQRGTSGINYSGNSSCPTIGLFDVELFPKQDAVKNGGYGNLVRMELGIHRKSNQPGFIIDTGLADSYYLEPVSNPLAVLEKILGE